MVFKNPIASPSIENPNEQSNSDLLNVDYENVIELFNPTAESIDLSVYSIILTPESGNPLTQNLYGSIEARSTALISNFNSNSDITSVAEVVSTLLEFSGKVQIELRNNGVPIDRVGQTGNENAVDININALLSNPLYLNGQEIDLSSISNLSIRRNFGVSKGNLVFDPEILVQEWAVYPSNVLDNLGYYQGFCNTITFGFDLTDNFIILERQESSGLPFKVLLQYNNPFASDYDFWDSDFKFDYDITNQGSGTASPTDYSDWSWGTQTFTSGSDATNNSHQHGQNISPTPDYLNEDNETINYGLQVSNIVNWPVGMLITDQIVEVTYPNVTYTIIESDELSVSEKDHMLNIDINPRITTSLININNSDNLHISKIIIYDIKGSIVMKIEYHTNQINIENLSYGYYTVKIITNKGSKNFKILKNE